MRRCRAGLSEDVVREERGNEGGEAASRRPGGAVYCSRMETGGAVGERGDRDSRPEEKEREMDPASYPWQRSVDADHRFLKRFL